MIILGLQLGSQLETEYHRSSYNFHDSAAVLLRDGKIVAAIEEERLSRVKHCNFFPKRAIDFCLSQAGIGLHEVDVVAVNLTAHDADTIALNKAYQDRSVEMKSGAQMLSEHFELFYQQSIANKLFYCNHHSAHAWSAFALSGFEKSLVMVLDGRGPNGEGGELSGLIGTAKNGKFSLVREMDLEQSLGIFYSSAIRFIGYEFFDEYKVMGLAPYGDPSKFRSLFRKLYSLKEDGHYTISENRRREILQGLLKMGSFKSLRTKGQPIEQAHKDFAAALQESLEEITLHVLKGVLKEHNEEYLCFAGGVAHNCTLNGKIEDSGLFKSVFVQPIAHDAGGALGAALSAQASQGKISQNKLDHLFYGTPIPQSDLIAEELSTWEPAIKSVISENICADAANLIANDAVIGWVQGRSEFGPRSLGNRSILADPRLAENKSRINKMIKKREGYRPFAPSVLAERASDFFEFNPNSKSLFFMNLIAQVKPEKRENLGAITHVDGTARIQVVTREGNPKYWDLINEFNKIAGTPILLNTSFNNNVEPIVDSIADAIVCFLTTELTHLVIDNHIISRNESVRNYFHRFYIGIKESYKVVSGYKADSSGFARVHSIEFNANRSFASTSKEISENLFRLISYGQNQEIGVVAKDLNIHLDDKLIDEIYTLWSERWITLKPGRVEFS